MGAMHRQCTYVVFNSTSIRTVPAAISCLAALTALDLKKVSDNPLISLQGSRGPAVEPSQSAVTVVGRPAPYFWCWKTRWSCRASRLMPMGCTVVHAIVGIPDS